MELDSKRKVLLLVLAACIAFSVIFTKTMTAANLDHAHVQGVSALSLQAYQSGVVDCNHGCSSCGQIDAAKYFLNTLKQAGLFIFWAACMVFLHLFQKKYSEFNCYPLSPIALRVRFNC